MNGSVVILAILVAAALAAVFTLGFSHPQSPPPDPPPPPGPSSSADAPAPRASISQDDLNTLALRNLFPDLGHGQNSVSFELGYGDEKALDAQRDRIVAMREKVNAMSDQRVRGAYLKWVDWFQKENDDARAEMETGAKRKKWLEYKRKDELERERLKAFGGAVPKP